MESILFFFALWVLGGLFLIGSYISQWRRARVADGWPACQGIVDQVVMRDPPHVIYSYRVRGEFYKSDQISLTNLSLRKSGKLIQKYPQGRPVTVFYDPDDPATAILERSVSDSGLIWGILLVVSGMIGFFSMLPEG